MNNLRTTIRKQVDSKLTHRLLCNNAESQQLTRTSQFGNTVTAIYRVCNWPVQFLCDHTMAFSHAKNTDARYGTYNDAGRDINYHGPISYQIIDCERFNLLTCRLLY